jgi:hypothetical protein
LRTLQRTSGNTQTPETQNREERSIRLYYVETEQDPDIDYRDLGDALDLLEKLHRDQRRLIIDCDRCQRIVLTTVNCDCNLERHEVIHLIRTQANFELDTDPGYSDTSSTS